MRLRRGTQRRAPTRVLHRIAFRVDKARDQVLIVVADPWASLVRDMVLEAHLHPRHCATTGEAECALREDHSHIGYVVIGSATADSTVLRHLVEREYPQIRCVSLIL